MAFAMEVYVELALAENFCMDWVLMYCAKLVTKNTCSAARITLAAAAGACFAVVFPFFDIDGALAVAVKILSGAAICLIAGRYSRLSGYIKYTVCFTAFTFALGGAIIALFELTGWDYSSGAGYVLASVPIGIPLFGALWLIIAARKIASAITARYSKNNVRLRIYAGKSCAELKAFYDSGNKLHYMGEPVSVIPEATARGLVDCSRIKTFLTVHTVAGSKKMAVFTADKIEINDGEIDRVLYNVKLGISPAAIRLAVLNPDLSEDN